jgi:hypothetical protein
MSNFIGDNSAPPSNWEQIVPRYRVTRDVHPSPKPRFRLEAPFSQILDRDEYQYGERVYRAGEEVATKAWPHPSWRALNFTAEKILAFFNNEMKSRLPTSPYDRSGRLRLSNGLSDAPLVVDPRPPQIKTTGQAA